MIATSVPRLLVAAVMVFGSGAFCSPAVHRLYRRVFTRAKPESTGNCTAHDWANWSAPQPLQVSVSNYGPGYGAEQVREGLFQDRFCTRCNLYERRVT